ncbi:MAG TPA: hypothetical protein H9700_12165 [Candidatus Eisenbergiella intestinipullorum]|nr:hypothetical protein [Candidatus Eisenbergiella intestinipullorum]
MLTESMLRKVFIFRKSPKKPFKIHYNTWIYGRKSFFPFEKREKIGSFLGFLSEKKSSFAPKKKLL